jgi:5-methylcytosine-specific restriction enzyme A
VPRRPPQPCTQPGCDELVESGACTKHQEQRAQEAAETRQRVDRDRGSSTQRGYGRKWRAARDAFLAANPLCVACLKEGIERLAGVVDHVVPHKGDLKLFWRRSNWQALCSTCHNRKTALEDGRWGTTTTTTTR